MTAFVMSNLSGLVGTPLIFAQEPAGIPTTSTPVATTQEVLWQSVNACFDAVRSGDLTRLPEFAEYLRDPRLNTAARTTLENLPDKAGLETIRQALQGSETNCVAGIISSLGSMRDRESVLALTKLATDAEQPEIIRVVALKSLGKLATPEAIAVLQNTLTDADINCRKAAADGLFTAAQESSDSAQNAEWFRLVREANIDETTTRIAAQNEIRLTGNAGLFQRLLLSNDPADFRCAQIVLTQTSEPSIFDAAVQSLTQLSTTNQIKTLATLGVSGNQALVPALLPLWDNESISKTALLEALGNLKDVRTLETLLTALSSEDEAVRQTAVFAISQLPSPEIQDSVAQLLIAGTPATDPQKSQRCLAGLQIVERGKIAELLPQVRACMEQEPDSGLASVALRVYSEVLIPTPDDLADFITNFAGQKKFQPEVVETAMNAFCQKIRDKEAAISLFEKIYAQTPDELVRHIGMINGKEAVSFLYKYAIKYARDTSPTGQAVIDEITRALGKWPTAEASPVLAYLAVVLPEGKYKTRALRGYLRIARQMGMTPLEKRQMVSSALQMTEKSPKERDLLEEDLQRFNAQYPETSLFNGKDFTGWDMVENIFNIEDGVIVGGNSETGIDKNQFLATTESYGDFYLRLECKVVCSPNNSSNDGNAGIQFRSERIPDNNEMIGYQADMTSDGSYWGCLYDESRRNKMLQVPDPELQKQIWKPNDWNRYEILCQGKNIRIFLNGVETVNYTEPEDGIAQTGRIGLQIHAGGPTCSYYRNLFICTAATSDSRW